MDLEEEARSIRREVERTAQSEVDVHLHTATRPQDLIEAVRLEKPDVVHFMGHGSLEGISLREEDQKHIMVVADSLKSFFKDRGVKVVFLNSCLSEEQAHAIAEVVPCVVGTSNSLLDESAKKFAPMFYSGLARGFKVADAFRDASDLLGMSRLENEYVIFGDDSLNLL